MARLAPGVSVAQAQAAVGGIASSIALAHVDTHDQFAVRLTPARGAGPHDRGAVSAVALLPAVPFMILLIACANVAGLLLSRGIGRAREIAVRIALGATRGQIVRQLLAESLLLSLLGCAGSLLVLLWGPDLLIRLIGAPLTGDLSPDARVILFTVALSVLTAVLFGLAPALRAASGAAPASLRGGAGASDTRRSTRLQRVLVTGQLALSLVLLSASGLFLQSLIEASRADVGFQTEGRVTLSFDLKMQRYSPERASAFYRTLMERVSALPGIRSASYASYIPLGGRVSFSPVYPASGPVDSGERLPTAGINAVSPGFFETFQLPMVRGRSLDARDAASGAGTAVVNETFARRIFPDGDVIGQRFRLEGPNRPVREIVGVTRDVIIDEFGEQPRPFVYVPHDRRAEEVSLMAWASIDAGSALRMLERTVHEIDPAVAVFEPRTMDQHLANRMDGERGLSRLFAVAGGLSVTLAAFGLYGVIAYTVARRTREIGVRMALGARAEDVARLFIVDGARVALLGLAAGALPAVGVGILLSGALFGVHPADVRALGAAAVVLGGAAVLASYLPARRVMRVDPLIALRIE
jgi:predicted permease